MPTRLSRTEALRILGLDPGADLSAVKRAYRRLARESHPDAGGDPARFHEVRTAYDLLVPQTPGVRPRPANRGSRSPAADWADPPTKLFSDEVVDTGAVDWSCEVPARSSVRAGVDRVAVLLASPGPPPLSAVTARSRGPRSPLNRLIPLLDPDLTASWRIGAASDRGLPGHDIEVRLRAWSRAARRRIDHGELLVGWTAERGSSSTTLVRTLHPSRDRRASAVRAVQTLDGLLDVIGWPLDTWFLSHSDQ